MWSEPLSNFKNLDDVALTRKTLYSFISKYIFDMKFSLLFFSNVKEITSTKDSMQCLVSNENQPKQEPQKEVDDINVVAARTKTYPKIRQNFIPYPVRICFAYFCYSFFDLNII